MKIGILTFHSAHNYGAVYQALALKNFLIIKGYDVDIIGYRPHYIEDKYALFPKKNGMKGFVKELVKLPSKIARRKKFEKFIEDFISPNENQDDWRDYDVYVVGSDQVWSPLITNYDPFYFGDFERKKTSKLIGYAPSFELSDLDKDDPLKMASFINRFDCVSVRELSAFSLLQPIVNRPISLVIDPTLLIDSSFWNRFVSKTTDDEGYVLVYQVRVSATVLERAKSIAKAIGAKLKVVVTNRYNNPFADFQYIKPGPIEFLNLIYHAKLVISSSFHGVALSVAYKKPFFAFYMSDGRNDRIRTLLMKLGLEHRFLSIESELTNILHIDYDDVDVKLSEFRKESEQYLLQAVELYEKN